MWPAEGSPLAIWADAMTMQTLHEGVCTPCRLKGTPACAEGEALQQAAYDAHGEWGSRQYAGRAVAA